MSITVDSYTLNLFPGERPDVFYLPGSAEEGQTVFALLPQPRPALVCIDGIDWDRELSPWPAPRAFKGGNDFGGGAAAFLEVLEKQLVPAAEQELGFTPESRGLAGYSLGGLFTLWAMGQTETFQRFASMSGSAWYDDFLDYFTRHLPQKAPLKVSISLGDGVKRAKYPCFLPQRERRSLQRCERPHRQGHRRGILVLFALCFGSGPFQRKSRSLFHRYYFVSPKIFIVFLQNLPLQPCIFWQRLI